MIAALLLAAATAAASPAALDGVSLGDDLAKVAAAHQTFRTWTALGPAVSWRRDGGGTMMISGGTSGKVEVIAFTADQGQSGGIGIPVLDDAFDVRATAKSLQDAIGRAPMDTCQPIYSGGTCVGYGVHGGTEMIVQFEGPNDGPLRKVTWATHETLLRLHVLLPPTKIT